MGTDMAKPTYNFMMMKNISLPEMSEGVPTKKSKKFLIESDI